MEQVAKTFGVVVGVAGMIALWLGPPIVTVWIVVHFIRKFW